MQIVRRYFSWLISIGLHLVLVILLLVHWPTSRQTVMEPPAIQAVVLDRTDALTHSLKKAEERPKPKPKPDVHKEKARPKPKTVSRPKPLPDFTQPDMAAQIARENVAMAEQQQQELTVAQQVEKEQKQEAAAQQLEQDSETAAAVAAIKNALSANWRRPPSARNGMEVLLQIRLLPGGDVLSVSVLKSSGDKALDASAVAAVENASPLPVPSGELFDKFRKFTLRFRPEDLRL
jgi:colicin import membrane protein